MYNIVFEIASDAVVELPKYNTDTFALLDEVRKELAASNLFIKENFNEVNIDIKSESIASDGRYTVKVRWHDLYYCEIAAISDSEAIMSAKESIMKRYPSINFTFAVANIQQGVIT